jgi:predicted PurR-regulated permease PerM
MHPMNQRQLATVCFLAFLFFIIFNLGLILLPFFTATFWSRLLAFGVYPFYSALVRRLGGRRGIAAAFMTGVIFLTIVPLILAVFFQLAKEAFDLVKRLAEFMRAGGLDTFWDWALSLGVVKRMRESGFGDLAALRPRIEEWLLGSAGTAGHLVLRETGAIVRNVIAAALNCLLSFFMLFFFLRDGERIIRFIRETIPLDPDTKERIFTEISETFAAVLRGQIVTSIAQSALAGLAFWALGLPLPIFFTAVCFLLTFIPTGAATVWFGFVIYLLVERHPLKAGFLFLFGTFVISLVDNFLKPYLIGEKTKIPYLLLFLGILGGLRVYGLMGAFLAPVVISLFFALTKIFHEKLAEGEKPLP